MPWKETSVMEERIKFVADYLSGEYTRVELARLYGISRPTVYKWIARFEAEGVEGLKDQSRAPQHHPNAVAEEMETRIVKAREAHPKWGAKKLLPWLKKKYPEQADWPAQSTIGEVLKRHGLVHARRRKRRAYPSEGPLRKSEEANAVWCADFKGWFRTRDGKKCTPLTLTDAYSRYLLRCQGLEPTGLDHVKPLFEAAFREYGLPEVIRTDNGAPFASTGLLGLSPLSIWWMKLGIVPERIQPGKPQQNGSHERMHRTLKEETLCPPASTLRVQQRVFDRFQEEYNEQRPHEALGQVPPASMYTASPRPYPVRVPEFQYPEGMWVRKVEERGQISIWSHRWFLSEVLAGEFIGIEETEGDQWNVYLSYLKIATIDRRQMTLYIEETKRKQARKAEKRV